MLVGVVRWGRGLVIDDQGHCAGEHRLVVCSRPFEADFLSVFAEGALLT